MELYIIRHAIAEDREEFRLKNSDDSKRPLTKDGRKQFKQISKFLKKLLGPIDLIVTSPYLRADQTANLLGKEFTNTKVVTSSTLTPAAVPSDFAKWCKDHLKKNTKQIVIVGHEPHLSILASWLLFGSYQRRVVIKKGGCLALKINGSIGAKKGILQWAITPKSLGIQ